MISKSRSALPVRNLSGSVFSCSSVIKNEKPCSRVKRSSYLSFTWASILANNASLSPSTKCIYKASPRMGECGAKAVPFGTIHLSDPVNGAYKVLQFCILSQFEDVLVNLQCFNLFLCSHRFLLFFAKVGNLLDLSK